MRKTIIECDLCGKPNIELNDEATTIKFDYGRGLRSIDVCKGCYRHVRAAVNECKEMNPRYDIKGQK